MLPQTALDDSHDMARFIAKSVESLVSDSLPRRKTHRKDSHYIAILGAVTYGLEAPDSQEAHDSQAQEAQPVDVPPCRFCDEASDSQGLVTVPVRLAQDSHTLKDRAACETHLQEAQAKGLEAQPWPHLRDSDGPEDRGHGPTREDRDSPTGPSDDSDEAQPDSQPVSRYIPLGAQR